MLKFKKPLSLLLALNSVAAGTLPCVALSENIKPVVEQTSLDAAKLARRKLARRIRKQEARSKK